MKASYVFLLLVAGEDELRIVATSTYATIVTAVDQGAAWLQKQYER
jgi:hypothetical protein